MGTPILQLESETISPDDYIPFGDVSSNQPRKCLVSDLYNLVSPLPMRVQAVPLANKSSSFSLTCLNTQRDLWICFDGMTAPQNTDFIVNLTLPPSPVNDQRIRFSLFTDNTGIWVTSVDFYGDFLEVMGAFDNSRYHNRIQFGASPSGVIYYNSTLAVWIQESGFSRGESYEE
jgi:hypothetical protein